MKFDKKTKEITKTALKGVLGAVPLVGNLLDEVIFEHRSRIKQERLNTFIEQLNDYFESKLNDEVNLDLNPLGTEEFSDIFERILQSVSQSSADHKHQIFRNIIVKRLVTNNESKDLELKYIEITNSISEIQYVILSHYASLKDEDLFLPVKFQKYKYRKNPLILTKYDIRDERKKNRLLYDKWQNIKDPNNPETYSITSDYFEISVTDMISKGLLFDYSNKEEFIDPNEYFGITLLGRKYIEYVKDETTYNKTR